MRGPAKRILGKTVRQRYSRRNQVVRPKTRFARYSNDAFHPQERHCSFARPFAMASESAKLRRNLLRPQESLMGSIT